MKTTFYFLMTTAVLSSFAPANTHAADGMPLWTNYFNGTGNRDDSAKAVAVDRSGNVYVTGETTGGFGYIYNYTTIKYSASGSMLWKNVFNSATFIDDYGYHNNDALASAMAIDASGNVYVTGNVHVMYTATNYYATIKYSTGGAALWTNLLYGGSQRLSDFNAAVAVDGSNSVLLLGTTVDTNYYSWFTTIKYSTDGIPLWTNLFKGDNAGGMSVDSDGNVYVMGQTYSGTNYPFLSFSYTTIKYSSAGALIWTNVFDAGIYDVNDQGYQGYILPGKLAVDGNANVLVAGTLIDSWGLLNYVTIKYSAAGVPLWTNLFNFTGFGDDSAAALAADTSGNVYVTGYMTDDEGFENYATVKYSGAGAALWTNIFSGTGNGYDRPTALALDGSGNVCVTGSALNIGSGYDYATIKYSSSGVALWMNFFSGPGTGYDGANALAVDTNGNVYVTGSASGTVSYSDYATIKYSSANSASNAIPALGISTYVGNQSAIFWPASGSGYMLQMCTNLASGNWITVSNYTPIIGVLVTNPPAGAAFFRLQ